MSPMLRNGRLRPGDGRDQPPGGLGHLVHRLVERLFVALGGSAVSADLADELQGRLPDLGLVRGDVALAQTLDASAHGPDGTGRGPVGPGRPGSSPGSLPGSAPVPMLPNACSMPSNASIPSSGPPWSTWAVPCWWSPGPAPARPGRSPAGSPASSTAASRPNASCC